MKGLYTLAIISSAALAAATPSPIVKRALPKCLFRSRSTAKYDIVSAPAIGGLDALTPTRPSGVLGYEKFSTVNINATDLNDPNLLDSLTLNPPSPPNVITTGTSRTLGNSPPKFIPADESVSRFDMETVRFACAFAVAGLNPVTCRIKLVGKKADGSKDVETRVNFEPDASGEFGSADLGVAGFTELVAVEITLLGGGSLAAGKNILFDDVFSVGCVFDPNDPQF